MSSNPPHEKALLSPGEQCFFISSDIQKHATASQQHHIVIERHGMGIQRTGVDKA